MPHIIVEYSKNLETEIDVPSVLTSLHESLAGQGIDKARIKTRGIALAHSVVGESATNEGRMMHATLLLLEGRDAETKRQFATPLHDILKDAVKDKACKVTLEVRDMVKDTYYL